MRDIEAIIRGVVLVLGASKMDYLKIRDLELMIRMGRDVMEYLAGILLYGFGCDRYLRDRGVCDELAYARFMHRVEVRLGISLY